MRGMYVFAPPPPQLAPKHPSTRRTSPVRSCPEPPTHHPPTPPNCGARPRANAGRAPGSHAARSTAPAPPEPVRRPRLCFAARPAVSPAAAAASARLARGSRHPSKTHPHCVTPVPARRTSAAGRGWERHHCSSAAAGPPTGAARGQQFFIFPRACVADACALPTCVVSAALLPTIGIRAARAPPPPWPPPRERLVPRQRLMPPYEAEKASHANLEGARRRPGLCVSAAGRPGAGQGARSSLGPRPPAAPLTRAAARLAARRRALHCSGACLEAPPKCFSICLYARKQPKQAHKKKKAHNSNPGSRHPGAHMRRAPRRPAPRAAGRRRSHATYRQNLCCCRLYRAAARPAVGPAAAPESVVLARVVPTTPNSAPPYSSRPLPTAPLRRAGARRATRRLQRRPPPPSGRRRAPARPPTLFVPRARYRYRCRLGPSDRMRARSSVPHPLTDALPRPACG